MVDEVQSFFASYKLTQVIGYVTVFNWIYFKCKYVNKWHLSRLLVDIQVKRKSTVSRSPLENCIMWQTI